jgi:FtsP/CotA-like multicopper oxidase with cupredoxin domain
MQSNGARAGVLVALLAIAVVLFVALSGGDDSDSDSGSETTTTEEATVATQPATPPEPDAFQIQLRDGAPAGGVAQFEVTRGDQVRIAITSDEDAELHIHGYEIEDQLVAGQTTRVAFDADIDGKFEIEAHSHATGDIPLGELTVQPG